MPKAPRNVPILAPSPITPLVGALIGHQNQSVSAFLATADRELSTLLDDGDEPLSESAISRAVSRVAARATGRFRRSEARYRVWASKATAADADPIDDVILDGQHAAFALGLALGLRLR